MKDLKFILGLLILISLFSFISSEYYFNVNLEYQNNNTSSDIQLEKISSPDSDYDGTLNFRFGINYSGNKSCEFKINDIERANNQTIELEEGIQNWNLYCYDLLDNNISNSISGNFEINESFSLSPIPNEDFFLINNGEFYAGEDKILEVKSNKPSDAFLYVFKDGNLLETRKINQISLENLNLYEIINGSGNYTISATFTRLAKNITRSVGFSIGEVKVEIITSENNRKTGNEIKINASVYSPDKKINSILYHYIFPTMANDTYFSLTPVNNFQKIFTKIYSESGTKVIKFSFYINKWYFIEMPLNIQSNIDEEPPVIKLIYPADYSTLNKDNITFRYEVKDNINVSKCVFSLYNATIIGSGAQEGNKVFPLTALDNNTAVSQNLGKNNSVNVTLKNFDERDYIWEVVCYDNSLNKDSDWGFFSIENSSNILLISNTETYDEQKEVEYLISEVNRYLEEEYDFTPEEKDVVNYLGISANVTSFKKKLLQIDQDFKHNLDFISDVELRESREEELRNQIKEIKNKIPLEIEIADSYEYVKNTVGIDFGELVEDYAKGTNTILSSKEKKELVKTLEELQNELNVETSIKHIEITYNDSKEKLTLIVKKIEIDSSDELKILEVIPKEIASSADDINFLVENKIIKEDPIFSVDFDSLENSEIFYSLNGYIDFEDLENTETVAFIETSENSNGAITGYFIFDITGDNPVYYAIIILLGCIFIFGAVIIFKKFRKVKFEEDPNTDRVIENISRAFRLIKQKDVEGARESYHKISAIYPLLREDAKRYLYGRIIQVYRAIEKYDLIDLLREYKNAKRQFKKEESKKIYFEIQQIYKHLSKKDQRKLWKTVRDI